MTDNLTPEMLRAKAEARTYTGTGLEPGMEHSQISREELRRYAAAWEADRKRLETVDIAEKDEDGTRNDAPSEMNYLEAAAWACGWNDARKAYRAALAAGEERDVK